jgi:Carboxypeptidase regulatory-like domain
MGYVNTARAVERGRIVVCLLAAWLIAAPAAAQLDRSRVSGTIKDSSGGIVPGATVTAINLQTQAQSVAVTDASGFYTFPNLVPGRYSVTAELQGFRKVVNENVQLDAAATLTMDFTLQAGALTETVTVSANTPLQTDVAIRKTV